MKRFILPLLMLMLFSSTMFAQLSATDSDATENWNGTDTRTLLMIYDIDSAQTLTTRQFSLDDFDGGISATHPITVYHDQATDGAPATTANLEIILWGVYNGGSYTYPLDTAQVAAANQGVDDTLSTLTLNSWSAPAYYFTITNTGGNASAVTVVTIPLREHRRVSELDNTW